MEFAPKMDAPTFFNNFMKILKKTSQIIIQTSSKKVKFLHFSDFQIPYLDIQKRYGNFNFTDRKAMEN